jgi:tRNA uridine 5-carboxymethylaminomethyl modification enzyme
LHLRIDNADQRLTPHGRRLGLIDDRAWAAFEAKQSRLAALQSLLESTRLTDADINTLSRHSAAEEKPVILSEARSPESKNPDAADINPTAKNLSTTGPTSPALTRSDLFAQLLKRPAITIEQLLPALLPRLEANAIFAPWTRALGTRHSAVGPVPAFVRNELKTVETQIKFAGYLAQQQKSMARLRADEARAIPPAFDYAACSGLSREMVEKLSRVRPSTLGQASRIAGVTPAAVSLIQCFLEIQKRQRHAA